MPTQGAGTNVGQGARVTASDNHRNVIYTPSQENIHARKLQIPADLRPGWLLELAVEVWGSGSSVQGRLFFSGDDATGGALLAQSPTQTWGTNPAGVGAGAWKRYFPETNPPRIESGKSYWVGAWTPLTASRGVSVSSDFSEPRARLRLASVPDSFTGFAVEDDSLAADFFYQQNANPSQGAWRPGAPSGTVNTNQPTFEGTMPHNNGDGSFDYTDAVHLVIWRTDTNQILHDNVLEVSPQERSQGYFSRTPLTLPTGVPLKAKYRHRDSWGAFSIESIELSFQCAIGPIEATQTAPLGKLNSLSGYNYQGIYRTAAGLSANAVQVRLLNSLGTQTIADSGWISASVSPDAAFSVAWFHDLLDAGTDYLWEVRLRDTNSVVGPWARASFKTNSQPPKATNMTPAGNRETGEKILTATLADPDGDAVAHADIALYDITTGAYVASYDPFKTNVTTIVNGLLTHDAGSALTFDHRYQWKTRATDALTSVPNGFSSNQQGLEKATTEGFSAVAATVENSAEQAYAGTRSLKTTIPVWRSQGFESSTTDIIASNCSVARSAAQKRTGSYGLQVTLTTLQQGLDALVKYANNPAVGSRRYRWEAWAYSASATSLDLSKCYLQEQSGAGRTAAAAGSGLTSVPAATWTKITGEAVLASDWAASTQLVLRPARKADNTAYDPTKTLFYDDVAIYDEGADALVTAPIQKFDLSPSVSYSWSARVYCPAGTYLDLSKICLQENGGAARTVAAAGASVTAMSTGWNLVSGTGTTPSDWLGPTRLALRPARRSDNSGYDSTRAVYYDALSVDIGLLKGPWSEWQTFTYRAAPQVSTIYPTNGTPRNRVPSPSAEVDTSPPAWQEIGRTDEDFIEVVDDLDSAFGSRSWVATESATSTNEYEEVDGAGVDATLPRLVYLYAKKTSGVSNTTFVVDCYGSGGAYLGSVSPSSIAPIQGVDLSGEWSIYGGVIWPVGSPNSPALPSGTTTVKRRVLPSTGSEAVVRFDAFFSAELPPVATAADAAQAAKWYGYFDGETVGYDTTPGAARYYWSGTPGNSASDGLHVLKDPAAEMSISYSHPTALAKGDDKLTVEEGAGSKWVTVYDGAWAGGARTKIPLPSGVFKSERRYRLTLQVRDTNLISSTVSPILVDVRYDGPPEPHLIIARAEDSRAEVYLEWTQTGLSASKFAGYEVSVGDAGEIVALITDPGQTNYVYPFPEPGVPTPYRVRQVENRDLEQVESRYASSVVTSDFGEWWWIKDVEDPRAYKLPVRAYAGIAPEDSESPEMTSFRPLGRPERVHVVSVGRPQSGSITIRLMESDPDLPNKLKIVEALKERSNVAYLLGLRPVEKRFVQVTGVKHQPLQTPYYGAYTLDWEEAVWEEDYYKRTGETKV